MIATRSQLFSTSDRMWLDRNTVAPSPTASRRVSKNVCWTSGSRPDVGSSRISSSGRCWRAMITPTFCLLPLLYSRKRRLGSSSKRSISDAWYAGSTPPRRLAKYSRVCLPGQPVVEGELARDVADPPVDGDRVGVRLDAEDHRPAAGRPDQVEQGPDRGRLAGAVRPEEPEHLALLDAQVDVDDPAVGAVGLGELFGLDDRGHGRTSICPSSSYHWWRMAGSSVVIDPADNPRSRSNAVQ